MLGKQNIRMQKEKSRGKYIYKLVLEGERKKNDQYKQILEQTFLVH